MKRILLIICCIISAAGYAQKVNTFHVVDSSTGKPVPYTSISILKAKLAITTEADGVFNIPGKLGALRDTITLNAQTYAPLKLALSKLATVDTIRLTKVIGKHSEVKNKFSAKLILNNYLADDIGLYAGVATDDASFNYLQIAQRFAASTTNNRLASITINKTSDWMLTKFRIRIYDIDPANGGPGADLFGGIIDVDNQDYVNDFLNRRSDYTSYVESKKTTIDLNRYNIIIPHKNFFVAVEWLRDFFNASKAPVYNKFTKKIDTAIVFRPYVGISPVKGDKLNIWVMELNGKWKTYDHFYPLGTDLAIKATVEY